MAKAKTYQLTNWQGLIMGNGVMEVEITCPKCKHVTTRAECECKPSFYDD